MKHDAFQYSFSPRDFFFFVFAKKNCPRCGDKLTKRKEFHTASGSELNAGSSDPFFVQNAKVKEYTYSYYCINCDTKFSLTQLVKIRRHK